MSSSRQVLKFTAVPPPNYPSCHLLSPKSLPGDFIAGRHVLCGVIPPAGPAQIWHRSHRERYLHHGRARPPVFAGDFSTRCLTSFPELSNCSWPAEVDQLSSERHEGCRGISDTFPRSPFPYIECLECRLTGEGCSFHAPEPYGLRCQATHGEEKGRGGQEWNQTVRSKVEGFWSLGL